MHGKRSSIARIDSSSKLRLDRIDDAPLLDESWIHDLVVQMLQDTDRLFREALESSAVIPFITFISTHVGELCINPCFEVR